MRRRISLVVLGVIFLCCALPPSFDGSVESTEGGLRTAASWTLIGVGITINETDTTKDWTITAATYEWCSGSGTWLDPYAIENVSIDGQGIGSGIVVPHSDVYFVIEGCTVYNASGNGITLYDTSNGKAIDNNCSYNGGDCIAIESDVLSYDGCFNNTVINKAVNHNRLNGITLKGNGQECDDNTVERNAISCNGNSGISIVQTYNSR